MSQQLVTLSITWLCSQVTLINAAVTFRSVAIVEIDSSGRSIDIHLVDLLATSTISDLFRMEIIAY